MPVAAQGYPASAVPPAPAGRSLGWPPGILPSARRPAVLDAARTALIPLRPLTVGEILDGSFLVVRRNVRLMVGLPLVVAGGTAAYLLAGVGLGVLLGNTTVSGVQILLLVLMGLLGLFLLNQCLVWMTAILSRVSLQTVLGEGFAPSAGSVTLRTSLSLFWPLLGLSMLQYVAFAVIQTAITVVFYAVLFLILGLGMESSNVETLIGVAVSLICFLLFALSYGYISLTVPALAAEGRRAPGWIGKPAKPTTVITAFERSVRLVGLRNMLRVALVYAGGLLVSGSLIAVLAFGAYAIVLLFAQSISVDIYDLLTNPWVTGGTVAFAALIAMSALLAYLSAVQTLLYLDLRMRREGLDLAMRFDAVPVPQPAAPPVTWVPMPHTPPPWTPPPQTPPPQTPPPWTPPPVAGADPGVAPPPYGAPR